MSMKNLTEAWETFAQFYDLPNIKNEIEPWQQLWQDKPKVTELAVVDLLKDTTAFFPETGKALKSSLRRIKTWLRSTMAESRLNGLAMMSVYRKIIIKDLEDFNNKIVEKFPRNPGSLYFN